MSPRRALAAYVFGACACVQVFLAGSTRPGAAADAGTATTLRGQVLDESPSHRPVPHLKIAFCNTVPTGRNGRECANRRWRTVADGEGRFTLHGIKPGLYIMSGSSEDVAGYMGLASLDPSHGVQKFYVCSHKAQPQTCSSIGVASGM